MQPSEVCRVVVILQRAALIEKADCMVKVTFKVNTDPWEVHPSLTYEYASYKLPNQHTTVSAQYAARGIGNLCCNFHTSMRFS